MASANVITRTELKELLHYCPASGEFTWLKGPRAGRRAGCLVRKKKDKTAYVVLKIRRKKYYAHRLAFLYVLARWPTMTDHINGDGADNRWCNLRQVTATENNRNQSMNRLNKTGIPGVEWRGYDKLWRARIGGSRTGRVTLYEGKDLFEACCRRKVAEREHGFHPNHGRKSS